MYDYPIEKMGYQASLKPPSAQKAVRKLLVILVLFLLLQYFGILNYLAPGSLADSGMGYGMLFVIGLITSVHCVAMCGGINLSQTLQRGTKDISRLMFKNTLAYNMGRVISYTVIGGCLGAIGGLTGIGENLQATAFFQESSETAGRASHGSHGRTDAWSFSGSQKTEAPASVFR